MSPLPDYLPQLTLTKDDWKRMLSPLSEDAPTGEYLVYEGTYDKIREARRHDDPSLPQGDWKIALKKANWDEVLDLCVDTLNTRSKDIQIAAWVTEALLRLHGYVGLKAGLQLLIYFCENYWEKLYPPIEEEGDKELRLSPMVWLNEKLSLQLGDVPITAPTTNDAPPYTFIDRENAWALENRQIKEKKAAEAEGKVTRAKFLTSSTLTSRAFCVDLAKDLHENIELIDQLNELLNEYCGKEAPSFGKFRDRLVNIHRVVDLMVKEKPAYDNEEEETDDIDETTQTAILKKIAKTDMAPPICSRSEAYRRLAEAADYLLRTEPHSPTPYLVKRAIGWGNMSLTELLMELVNSENDLAGIYNLLGIKFDQD